MLEVNGHIGIIISCCTGIRYPPTSVGGPPEWNISPYPPFPTCTKDNAYTKQKPIQRSQPKQHGHNSQRTSTTIQTLITCGHDTSPHDHTAPRVFYWFPCLPTPWEKRLRSRGTTGTGGRSLGGRPSQQVVVAVWRSKHGALYLMVHRKEMFTPSARDKQASKTTNYGCFERSRSEAGRGRVH